MKMDRISLFLENLNPRERILLLIFVALLGIFLGFRSYEGLFKDFLDEVIFLEEQDLLERKNQNSILQRNKIDLQKELEFQKQQLDLYQNIMRVFNLNYENCLVELEKLSQKYKLEIKDLQSFESEKKYFRKYDLTLQVQGEFRPLLQFIQELENLNYKLYYVELENLTSLKLVLKISFYLVNLKND